MMASDSRVVVVILKRSTSMSKSEWRSSSTRRTLDPIAIDPFVSRAFAEWQSNPISPAIVESQIKSDDQLDGLQVRKAEQTECSGVFLLQFVAGGVRLRISEEGCHRERCRPRQLSQYLTTLEPWKPVRVLLNGKGNTWDDPYYLMQDYHMVLCDDTERKEHATQLFDLQINLR